QSDLPLDQSCPRAETSCAVRISLPARSRNGLADRRAASRLRLDGTRARLSSRDAGPAPSPVRATLRHSFGQQLGRREAWSWTPRPLPALQRSTAQGG